MFFMLYIKYILLVSKHNSNSENQVNDSFNDSKWRRMTLSCIKKIISIIKRNNIMVTFVVWIVFILLEQKNKLQSHKKVRENKDFCNVIMPFEDTKILEFNQYQKSDKTPFVIYTDLECLIEKIDRCKNNPENLSISKRRQTYSNRFFNVYNIII